MSTVIQWNPQYDTAVSQFREPGIDLPCLMPWRFLFIQEHSKKVIGCPYHTIPYGDLATMSLEQIWNSEPIQEMRRSLLDKQIPRFCLNHSASCPVIADAQVNGYRPPADAEIIVGSNDYWYFGAGWFGMERIPEPIRWTSDRATFRISTANRRALQIELMTSRPDLTTTPMKGAIWIGERKLGAFTIDDPNWQSLLFPIGKNDRLDELEATITIDRTWTPDNGDTRKLGIAVRRISTF